MQAGYKEVLNSGKEYYEIRLDSIGGLGANLCGKMLGELGLKYLDVNSSSFSSYGSEKTGTPVKGFIRYCKKEKEIRLHAPITEPDLLVSFHEEFLEEASGTRYRIAAQKIAMETHSRINVVMLGAILKVMGVESTQPGEEMIKETLGKKYPASLDNNLQGMRRGYAEITVVETKNGSVDRNKQSAPISADNQESGDRKKGNKIDEPKWGYLTAPIGGINPNLGNSISNNLSHSRQGYVPLFIKEKCINCGLCFSACPDMVFQFVKGEYKGRSMMVNEGLDYDHCKGCLRCVDVCPVNALVRGVEAECEKLEYEMPNQELLRKPKYQETSGADGYITSESFLTEKRMEGGEV